MTSVLLVGPGRAGMSIALAAQDAGHHVVGVLGRSESFEAARRLDCPALGWRQTTFPTADLVIVAVPDRMIQLVADDLAGRVGGGLAVHLSGATSISSLDALAGHGMTTGSLHPLQSLPDPEVGRRALAGSAMAVTSADATTVAQLEEFAVSLGCRPFVLADSDKATYHAAASAASNFVTAVIGLAEELFKAAGVDPTVAQSLTMQTVRNAYELGPSAALTGPIARDDVETVRSQLAAAYRVSEQIGATYARLVRVTADLAGIELEQVFHGDS